MIVLLYREVTDFRFGIKAVAQRVIRAFGSVFSGRFFPAEAASHSAYVHTLSFELVFVRVKESALRLGGVGHLDFVFHEPQSQTAARPDMSV